MPRLIDADEAYKVLTDYYHHGMEIQHEALKEALSKVPTVDTEPRHGRWLDVLVADDDEGETDGVECSVCGYTDINVYWAKTYHRFCPNCGAKMDEVEDGNT
jgi:NADH pyrophosphatase NudC (nudix superfamily)